jgi:hypothetical protein
MNQVNLNSDEISSIWNMQDWFLIKNLMSNLCYRICLLLNNEYLRTQHKISKLIHHYDYQYNIYIYIKICRLIYLSRKYSISIYSWIIKCREEPTIYRLITNEKFHLSFIHLEYWLSLMVYKVLIIINEKTFFSFFTRFSSVTISDMFLISVTKFIQSLSFQAFAVNPFSLALSLSHHDTLFICYIKTDLLSGQSWK